MPQIRVVYLNHEGREQTEDLLGSDWYVQEGVLTVRDLDGNHLATYPQGKWLSIKKQ
jgi:hypothetical protein